MYRTNMNKEVLLKYIKDIEEELKDKNTNKESVLEIIELLKNYVREG